MSIYGPFGVKLPVVGTLRGNLHKINYETNNRSERKQVFASNSKFQIEIVIDEVTYSK